MLIEDTVFLSLACSMFIICIRCRFVWDYCSRINVSPKLLLFLVALRILFQMVSHYYVICHPSFNASFIIQTPLCCPCVCPCAFSCAGSAKCFILYLVGPEHCWHWALGPAAESTIIYYHHPIFHFRTNAVREQ